MLRKIGGGILLAVSVAVPVIVDKMDIHLTTQQGAALLIFCAVAGLIGLTLALWPQKKATHTGEAASSQPASTTAIATGGGVIDLENCDSTADTFAHAEKGSLVAARRVRHNPAGNKKNMVPPASSTGNGSQDR